ncbi:leucine--tRNA ligase [bacterium]|nr:leucine--tRNA ligase [bacterium]
MRKYDHKEIEKKWQERWERDNSFGAEDGNEKKYYCLIEFPYPSGDGIHAGHVRSYTAMDVIARKRRAEGYNVLFPIGWDAFGLPTENYAIKTGIHPREVTKKNTDNFRRQLKALGISFDWSREINTSDPAYYIWTQWIFLQLYKHGLAYKAKIAINWCFSCKIGLANEEVVDGKCERCGGATEKREKEQWMLKITKYADRLLKDLDSVDYLEKIKTQQRNWIGKSDGAEIDFKLSGIPGQEDGKHSVKIFTTRPDTIFGATFLAVSPDLAKKWLDIGWQANEEVKKYAANEFASRRARDFEEKEKTGVDAGIFAVNPANGEKIPVWVVNYVLGDVGTGAIMAVPAHDERDFEFAKKYDLPIKMVVCPHYPEKTCPVLDHAYTGAGHLVGSGAFDGMANEEAKKKIIEFVGGKQKTTYKLRDWVFSRQRYWGEPIPMIFCKECGWTPVSEEDLPVVLPDVQKYEPTDTGESPLANIAEWVNTTCPKCGGPARRETDVMPNWAGSSWYFLRYCDTENKTALADKEKLDYWMPVDWYNGGMEHTTLHLLYSRFWNKFLFDIGAVPVSEPYAKRTSHGLILAEGGVKMSKSKGNVVNPDDIVDHYGADTLRLYEMFMGPFEQAIGWSEDSLIGPRRFLEKVWGLREKVDKGVSDTADKELEALLHQTIKKVSEDIEAMRFNTAISQMMIFSNELEKRGSIPTDYFVSFLMLLAPFAPHIAEEIWESLGHEHPILHEPWPLYDADKIVVEAQTIAIQVNGKVRGTLITQVSSRENEILEEALRDERIKKWVGAGKVKKTIYIPGKVLNIVTVL